jgi:RimJ/RimL family protein N-acetyltransferase
VLGCAGLLPVIVPAGLTPAEAGEGRLEVELFFQLGRAHWGRGYMTEATEALCRLALVVLRLPRLFAATQAGNRRAVALLRRLGGAALALDRPPGSFWGREPVCAIVSGGRAADAGRG